MDIVVDTSIYLAVLLNEPERAAILRVTEDCLIFSPESVYWEIGNALSAMLKRNRIDIQTAGQVLKNFEKIPINYSKIKMKDALEIAERYSMYAYDAYLLECSRVSNRPLLTLDKKLISTARIMNLNVVEI